MILRDGLYLGFDFLAFSIWVWILSRIFFAIAVPSILVAVMAKGVLENCLVSVQVKIVGLFKNF